MRNSILFYLLFSAFLSAQQVDFPKLTGPYLGQKPPGRTPEVFAPEVFNPDRYTWHHSVIVFSPDGKEAFFQAGIPKRSVGGQDEGLFWIREIQSRWTEPRMFPFLDGNGDSPVLSQDGKSLYFLSTQPIPGLDGQKRKENIWVSKRAGDEWSEPKPLSRAINSLDMHWQISLDKKGNLYFGVWKVDPLTDRTLEHDIYVARWIDGQFSVPEKLGPEINSPETKQFSPHISPEGDYLLFTRTPKKPPYKTTLHLSFLDKAGGWMPPLDLSEILKITGGNAKITPDGKYLFCLAQQGRNVLWMDAGFVEELRPKE